MPKPQKDRSAAEEALVAILGRITDIAEDELSTAEKQIRDIALKALGIKAAKLFIKKEDGSISSK